MIQSLETPGTGLSNSKKSNTTTLRQAKVSITSADLPPNTAGTALEFVLVKEALNMAFSRKTMTAENAEARAGLGKPAQIGYEMKILGS